MTGVQTCALPIFSIAGEDHINVLIASGIVGGTGGGIFVDFTYMIHDLFRECHHKNYSICAYMFDAESRDDQDEKNQQMKLNGQKALKELQHNMNITTQEHLYHATIGQREITCRKTLFEEYKHISFCLGDDDKLDDLKKRMSTLMIEEFLY